MARVLVVHHTTSPALEEMLAAIIGGTREEGIAPVTVDVRPALSATVSDVLGADGFVLGTPANIGYMSGALKHFFDTIYYPCLDARRGAPYGLYVHGNLDATGAQRSVDAIVAGLGWQKVSRDVVVLGPPSRADLDACRDLGAVLAATVAGVA